MRYPDVDTVMTTELVATTPDTSFTQAARLLTEHAVSALPVLAASGRLIGVVSEADLMRKEQYRPEPTADHKPLLELPARREQRRRAHGLVVGDVMSEPVQTIRAHTPVTEAARALARSNVRRLFVVDAEDRLVGVLSRRDVLRLFLRGDQEIGEVVRHEVFERVLWADMALVVVTVEDGVVTLRGRLERRSEVDLAGRLTEAIPGVVGVVNSLRWELDDAQPEHAGGLPRVDPRAPGSFGPLRRDGR
ncbi:CBS domain-containing protein [Solihabitans fulvus]|uniref:CBS domain-containing protein n=1 Tax=Solihabitans fulvus TaxID=1892852 RepID=A0A5B2XER5_9PSEU|nr:CBS domain-containing protein [Solihabitans fulvus]KAA2261843.1 CBS domain-containing protein [Solihabitans fulvus]